MAYEYDPSTAPEMPGYEAFDFGQYYTGVEGPADIDTSAKDELEKDALRGAGVDSTWATLMLGKQGTEELGQRDRAAAEAAGAAAMARSNIAQRGGLTGGASERLAAGSIKDQMMRNQEIARGGTQARQDLRIQDETQRKADIGQLHGMSSDIFNTGLAQSNFDLAMANQQAGYGSSEADRQAMYDQTKYQEDMKKWYGEQMAAAQEAINSGEMTQAQKDFENSQIDTGLIGGLTLGGKQIVAPGTPGATKDAFGNWVKSTDKNHRVDQRLIGKKDLWGREIVDPSTPGAKKDLFGNYFVG